MGLCIDLCIAPAFEQRSEQKQGIFVQFSVQPTNNNAKQKTRTTLKSSGSHNINL